MLRQVLLTIAFTLASTPAVALCGGDSFADRLTAAENAEIDALRATTPFATGNQWIATRGDDQLTIVGTMHLRDPRLLPIMEGLQAPVASSDLILLEATPVEEAQVMDYMSQNPELLFSTDGPTLPESLSEETWQALSEAARARGIPPVLASKMQPWYLMLTLGIPVCAMADMAAGKRGLDHMIIEAATTTGTPMAALEPFDTIFAIMQNSPRSEQIEMLEVSVLDPTLQQEMFVAMLDNYFAGDAFAVLHMSEIAARRSIDLPATEIAALTAEALQAMLYDRNHAWIPVIEQATVDNNTILIAVGAGHLPGEQGILSLLEQRGWTVTER